MPHTHFDRGQRVRIILRDGTILYRRFVERRGRTIKVATMDTGAHEEIQTRLLKVVSIYKGAGGRASPALKIPRQAEHGTGGILDTGLREKCEAKAGSGGSNA